MKGIKAAWRFVRAYDQYVAYTVAAAVFVISVLTAFDRVGQDDALPIATALLAIVLMLIVRLWSLPSQMSQTQKALVEVPRKLAEFEADMRSISSNCSYTVISERITWDIKSKDEDRAVQTIQRAIRVNHTGNFTFDFRSHGSGGSGASETKQVLWRYRSRNGSRKPKWLDPINTWRFEHKSKEYEFVFLQKDLDPDRELDLKIVRELNGRFPDPDEDVSVICKPYSPSHRVLSIIWPPGVRPTDVEIVQADKQSRDGRITKSDGDRWKLEITEPTGSPGDPTLIKWRW